MRRPLVVLLALTCFAAAQEPKPEQQKPSPASEKKKPPVDPDKDKALRLLARAEAEVLRMDPLVKSGLCLEIMGAYSRTADKEDVVRVANECFRAALEIEDNKELRRDRELRALDVLASLTPEALPDLEQIADPEVRSKIEGILFTNDVHAKHYEQALQRVSELGRVKGFPFDDAATLMSSLPADKEQEKRDVFAAALQSYRQYPDPGEDRMPRHEDIATLILHFSRQLPGHLLEEAIDDILNNAKEASKDHSTSLTLNNAQGQVGFDSPYQMRLFELLPVLRELDGSKAEKLMRDNAFLTKVMDKYPDGLRSFEPAYADDSGATFNGMSIGYSSNSMAQASMMVMNDEQRAIDDIVNLTETDAKLALARARGLSQWPDNYGNSPRALAMDGIAQKTWKKDTDIAKSAVKELVNATEFLEPVKKVSFILDAVSDYWGLNDKATAMMTASLLGRIARDLYKQDTASTPNRAVKLEWPSTAVWKTEVVLESRFHPTYFPNFIGQIQDDEIQWSLQIEFAKGLLGRSSKGFYVRKQFDPRYPGSFQYIQIPAFK